MSRRIARIIPENAENLGYYSIKYACIFGGRTHKKRITTGTRSSTTFRQDCSAHIKVLLSADQKFLEIIAVNADHNHVISEELNNSLPKQRRLAEEEKDKINKLMSLQVNKKLLKQQIVQETGKQVTLKDLSNIAAKNKGEVKSFNEV